MKGDSDPIFGVMARVPWAAVLVRPDARNDELAIVCATTTFPLYWGFGLRPPILNKAS
jgi:hypothetical protein